ncbi:MAG: hypothetical protein MHM6MM_002338 [Cercozoa sp. M6MM]
MSQGPSFDELWRVVSKPASDHGEVVLGEANNVHVYNRDQKRLINGHLVVTSHRMRWQGSGEARELALSHITEIEKRGFFLRATKLYLSLGGDTHGWLSFHDSSWKTLLPRIENALRQKAWLREKAIREEARAPTLGARSAGIGGLERNLRLQQAQADASLEDAFADLSTLMDKAGELVSLSNKFTQRQEQRKKRMNATESIDESEDDKVVADIVANLGILSPVTKRSGAGAYHVALAHELSKFLQQALPRFGGILQIPEAFCLFNRARGSELVSPQDMMHAVEAFPQIRSPITMHQFESGVSVLQSAEFSAQSMLQRILELLEEEQQNLPRHKWARLSSSLLAQKLHISAALALEHLLQAERIGELCRDETPHDIFFYKMRFL